jgi:hypothetical protein
MSNKDFDAVQPVEGEVIRVSQSTKTVIASLSFVLLVACLGLAWWLWQEGGFSIKVVVFGVVSLVCLVAGLVSLFMDFALILGADRLQNVRNGKVVGQVPYRNIAEISICKNDGVPSLGIKLSDEEDMETFWERSRAGWYVLSRNAWGYDVFITPDAQVEVILEIIQARRARQQKQN